VGVPRHGDLDLRAGPACHRRQTALAAAGENSKWIGGLHALDGMVILLLSLGLAITARRRRTAARDGR
jgi:hypothetical protein